MALAVVSPARATEAASLIDAASACTQAGDRCIAHCLSQFAAGDTMLAACAKSVQQMVVACGAVAKLAALESSHLPGFVRTCRDVCSDCEKECRKHAAHHDVCRACADACLAFLKASEIPA